MKPVQFSRLALGRRARLVYFGACVRLDAENIVLDFKSRIRVGLSACLLLSLASAQAWGQAAVGNANIVVNEVTGAVAGASRVLSVEDDIF